MILKFLWWRCAIVGEVTPDQNIGPGYLHRYIVFPRNRFFNVYIHKFLRSDDDRHLHDHPWASLSILLKGRVSEVTETGERRIRRFLPVLRGAQHAHRMVLESDYAWTIFIIGPRVRRWGFLTNRGWIYHKDYFVEDFNRDMAEQHLSEIQ